MLPAISAGECHMQKTIFLMHVTTTSMALYELTLDKCTNDSQQGIVSFYNTTKH